MSNWFINARVRLWRPMVLTSAKELRAADKGKADRGKQKKKARGK